jgi:hypothetical protein
MGVDSLHAYASVDRGHQTLLFKEEKVSLLSPVLGPLPTSQIVASDQAITCRMQGSGYGSIGEEHGVVRPNPDAHPPETAGRYV